MIALACANSISILDVFFSGVDSLIGLPSSDSSISGSKGVAGRGEGALIGPGGDSGASSTLGCFATRAARLEVKSSDANEPISLRVSFALELSARVEVPTVS